MTQIEKHKKAINILELIKELDFRIKKHNENLSIRIAYRFAFRRINIDTEIKKRLQNYYDKNFKI